MTRAEKRHLRILKENGVSYEIEETKTIKTSLHMDDISPLTNNQALTFESYSKNKNILLHGLAGTGKTFISMYLALKDVLYNKLPYKKVIVIRSVVPTRDMGFLPGSVTDKTKAYEGPYQAICTELFQRNDAYQILKTKGVVEFMTTSFIRGITISNAIVIVDEINNMTFHELDSVITRLGENCKVVLCGDFRQSDLPRQSDKLGLKRFMDILEHMGSFRYIEFDEDDIVRSAMVKEYIIMKDKLGYNDQVLIS